MEKLLELIPYPIAEQDGFCPAFTSTENIPVKETTTGNHTLKPVQPDAAGQNIAHMYIHSIEAGAGECCSHLHLPIHTLLTQNCNGRSNTRVDIRCRNIILGIVSQGYTQARIMVPVLRDRMLGA